MKPSGVVKALLTAFRANVAVMLWGAPGIGKSDVVRQAARLYAETETGPYMELFRIKVSACKSPNDLVKDVRLLLRNPVHISGLPDLQRTASGARTVYTMPDIIPAETDTQVVLFLDEIVAAPASVQAAAFQLVLDREVNGYRLPDYVRVVAAGNRKTDKAGANDMLRPLANRFMHVDFEVDSDDWLAWASRNHIRTEVSAYISWQPFALNVQPGQEIVIAGGKVTMDKDAKAFPTPRTWAFLSKLLDAGIPPEIELDMIRGTVGDGIAAAFSGFLRIYRNLPNPKAVLLNPAGAAVPSDTAARYAIAGALASLATPTTLSACLTYINRIKNSSGNQEREYNIVFMKDAIRRNPELQHTPEFGIWIADNHDIMFS